MRSLGGAAALLMLFVLLLVAGSQDPRSAFDRGLESRQSCAELRGTQTSVDPTSSLHERMGEILSSIGCDRSSERRID